MTDTPQPKILTDAAWAFIQVHAEQVDVTEHVTFVGDRDRWDWLISELFKRC